ncbi:MAG: DUF3662 and FHA domain-containing protein [Candidatus Nanopelagicales bacterium]|nr:DUF3662 and FHA domain-containing protein [Candidatus Nanopelagicales bacterium]
MGLLDRFEQRVDRAVNGAFAKAFKSEVQPVEIAAALQHEMDDRAAIVARGRTVVPNVFVVALSDEDYERLAVYSETLRAELASMVREYAEEQGYTFLGPVSVSLNLDSELDTGTIRTRSEAKAAVSAGAGASAGTPRLLAAGAEHPLNQGVTRLGRGADSDIRIDDPGVSRHHADIIVGNSAVIRDLGSTNGTYVNGVRVNESTLHDGAKVRLGSTTLTFRSGS